MKEKIMQGFVFFVMMLVMVGLENSIKDAYAENEFIKVIIKGAKEGNPEDQYNLGGYYILGKGVPQDYKEAVKWLTKSANKGYVKAQRMMAGLYYLGQFVPENRSEAAKWYTKAAEQGDALSQLQLGLMYDQGKGVSRDYVQAYKWFNLAVAQDVEQARKSMDSLITKMTTSQISEGQRLSREAIERMQRK